MERTRLTTDGSTRTARPFAVSLLHLAVVRAAAAMAKHRARHNARASSVPRRKLARRDCRRPSEHWQNIDHRRSPIAIPRSTSSPTRKAFVIGNRFDCQLSGSQWYASRKRAVTRPASCSHAGATQIRRSKHRSHTRYRATFQETRIIGNYWIVHERWVSLLLERWISKFSDSYCYASRVKR